ncbi:MAG: sugar ABC transporter permease [Anaerolineae bacterium]|nr:sugar ABC transporter permease [Anaerolineae bacterium]
MANEIGQTGPTRSLARFIPGRPRMRSGLVPIYVPFLFLIPALILLVVFRYYPTISAIYHSFTIWDIPKPGEFVGLKNYQALFSDPIFLQSISNILKYTVVRTLLTMTMAIIGAELVYNLASSSWRNIWRLVFTVPMVIPSTVDLLIWKQIYAGRQGLLNEILVGIGALNRPYPWIGRPDTALWALVFIGFPAVAGFGFLIILAALQNLPAEVNDAALIDGCSRLRRVFSIDLPAIRGPLALILILSLNGGLQQFAPMLVVTQGGPVNSTMSPGYYLYTQGFTYGAHGYASAIGTILMLMTLTLSIFIMRARYRRAYDVAI